MNRLINIIGLAPSEIDFSLLVAQLTEERVRVRGALERFRTRPARGTRTPSKNASEEMDIKKMLRDGEITKQELMEILKGAKK